MKIGRYNFSFSSFKKKRHDPLNNYYGADDWSTLYGSGGRWKRSSPKNGNWKTFYRIVVALGIFAALLVLKESTHPWSQQARDGLRVALTTEWDVTPALDKAVQIGLKTVNMDWPMFNEFTNPVLPAVTEPKPDGSWAVPVSGRIVQEFGWTKSQVDNLERFNPGIDISAPIGSPVKAVQPGIVSRIGHDRTYGEFILIEHRKGEYALYAGLTDINFKEGSKVQAGQVIGHVAEQPQGDPVLHFEVRENDKLIDPLKKLNLTSIVTDQPTVEGTGFKEDKVDQGQESKGQ